MPALYVVGDVSLFKNPGVAVVGARECTPMGLEATGRISMQLSKSGITVISGLALGIDRQAHLGGLRGVGSSVAVLGCGLDVDYPQDNRDVRRRLGEKGLVVTEYGPGVRPRPEHFPIRNRLISGLALGVLVAEAAHDSGSLITARLAGEQGREVFALPGPIGQAHVHRVPPAHQAGRCPGGERRGYRGDFALRFCPRVGGRVRPRAGGIR